LNHHRNGLSRKIYSMLRLKIDSGDLMPGQKMPSTRMLASDLGVSRSSVVAIYEQLASEGYIETSPGAHARVATGITISSTSSKKSEDLPKAQTHSISSYGQRIEGLTLPQPISAQTKEINFLYGALADADFPKLLWRRHYTQALMKRQNHLYYRAPEGEIELRDEVQGYLLRARGLSCSADQILIVQGSQQAIDLCARVLVDPGSAVIMEEPCYLMARRVFESIGAEVLSVPVDEHGLVTKELPKVKNSLIYVTPSHQFPLGAVLPIGRRRELLSWAKTNNAWIIEDDYDSEFRYGLRPTETLQSLDADGTVIYIGTFSKALSPQLRLGYLVLPMSLVKAFRNAKQLTDRHAPRVEQNAVAELIKSGAYERHIRRVKRENEQRRSVLIESIAKYLPEGTLIEGTATGLHIVVWLEDFRVEDEVAIVAQAKSLGVGIWSITPLYALGRKMRKQNCSGFILGYAGIMPSEIKKGIKLLAKALLVRR